MTSALVLLSGGMDSTTCLAIAKQEYDTVIALSVNYGQRHLKETEQAREICRWAEIPQPSIITLGGMPSSMLTDTSIDVPDISYGDIEGVSPTYVPFRNGQLLSKAACLAQAFGHDAVFFGAHAEDAHNWAYPDCTPEFIGAMANAIYVGTYHKVRLVTPLMWLMKSDIVEYGTHLRVPWGLTWSCYKGNDLHCGTCPTCQSRRDAFVKAKVTDPTRYANPHPNPID